LKDYRNFREVECDVTDVARLEPLFDGVDVVFHQAASKKTVCLRNPARDLEINAGGTLALLQLSVQHKIIKFVHASTGSVYGEARYHPQDEEHPLAPTSYYGVSKLAGERYVHVFDRIHGLDTTILRYFHVYGPRQESSDVGGVVSIFVRRLLSHQPITIFGDGTQQRSFTYVKDVVKANLLAAMSGVRSRGQVFNCASGIKVTVGQLADMCAISLGVKNPTIQYGDWVSGDIKVFDIDNRRIRETLGMEFMTDFAGGLGLTIDWGRNYFKSEGIGHV
jgi:UDP-glucose 4-epimerase